jgi:hypothetical protein
VKEYATEAQTSELVCHQHLRAEVLKDVERLFKRVKLQSRMVQLGVYSWPTPEGEEAAWESYFRVVNEMVAMVPPYPAWFHSIRSVKVECLQ